MTVLLRKDVVWIWGAILFQYTDEGVQQVVGYYSKQTTLDQQKYHSYELETMAVVFALRYFRVYLLGLQFKVITDCNALRTTFTKKGVNIGTVVHGAQL